MAIFSCKVLVVLFLAMAVRSSAEEMKVALSRPEPQGVLRAWLAERPEGLRVEVDAVRASGRLEVRVTHAFAKEVSLTLPSSAYAYFVLDGAGRQVNRVSLYGRPVTDEVVLEGREVVYRPPLVIWEEDAGRLEAGERYQLVVVNGGWQVAAGGWFEWGVGK